MAVAPSEAADWQIGRDSTVAERLDHATDGESVVQNNGAVTGRSRERRRARWLRTTHTKRSSISNCIGAESHSEKRGRTSPVGSRLRHSPMARGLIATTRSAINGSRVADLTQSIHGMDAHRATPRRTRTSGTANCVETV